MMGSKLGESHHVLLHQFHVESDTQCTCFLFVAIGTYSDNYLCERFFRGTRALAPAEVISSMLLPQPSA